MLRITDDVLERGGGARTAGHDNNWRLTPSPCPSPHGRGNLGGGVPSRLSALARKSAPVARRVGKLLAVMLGASSFWLAVPARAGEEAFVTNQNDDSLAIVDLDAMRVEARIGIPGKPAGVAVSRDGRRVYVTSPEGKALTVIDGEKRAVIRTIPLAGGPFGVAVHPSGAPVYVTDWYENRLFVVDAEGGTVIARVPVGQAPSGVAASADGKLIVTADRDSDQITLIDAASLKPLAVVRTGARPFGVTLDDAGGRAFTANVASNSVSVIDLATRKTVTEVKVGERPYVVALAQGKAFVTDQYGGTLTVFAAAGYAPLGRIKVGQYPEGVQASADGRFVYVANWFDNTLMKIDAATHRIEGSVETGDGPRAFGTFIRQKTPSPVTR